MALTSTGDLYSWGNGDCGQLANNLAIQRSQEADKRLSQCEGEYDVWFPQVRLSADSLTQNRTHTDILPR